MVIANWRELVIPNSLAATKNQQEQQFNHHNEVIVGITRFDWRYG